MLILGIETSCDETSASVVEVKDGIVRVRTNIVSSQIKKHAPFGGVVPSLAAREHVKNLAPVLKRALGKTKIKEIDLIAVTAGPGLISSLLVGTAFAKALAYKYQKPILGVNHIEGHIASTWLETVKSSRRLPDDNLRLFPALCLIVSGGHTQLVLMSSYGKYKLIGETLDDAAGEAFDKTARILGLGYPGGPAIAVRADKFKILDTKNWALGVKLPRPMLDSKNYNFSFAGLKTAVLYLVRNIKAKQKRLDAITKTSIAHEIQNAIVDVLVQKTIKAARMLKVKSVMLSGGVSANSHLRAELARATDKLGAEFLKPEMEYTTDNAAMIALAGFLKAKNNRQKMKNFGWKNIRADANWEIA